MADKLLVVRVRADIWETHARFPFLADPVLVSWKILHDHAAIGDCFGFVLTRKQPGRLGPKRWAIEVYREVRDDAAPLFMREVDVFAQHDNIALRHAIREMPNCFIAVGETEYPRFRQACDSEAVEIVETVSNDAIRTSPLPR